MSLTPKQEKFALVWHATGNKSEAYRQAYNAKNMSDAVVANKACELSAKVDVRSRFDELQKASQKRNNTTVDLLDAMLKEAFRVAKETSTASGMVSAVSALAKLHGLNAPDKQQVDHSGEITTITRRIVNG